MSQVDFIADISFDRAEGPRLGTIVKHCGIDVSGHQVRVFKSLKSLHWLTSLSLVAPHLPTVFSTEQPSQPQHIDTSLIALNTTFNKMPDTQGGDADIKPEDAAPKTINLLVNDPNGNEVNFRLKTTTPLAKMMKAYAQQTDRKLGMMRFLYDGIRLQDDDTPQSLEMKDCDYIQMVQEQQGGGMVLRRLGNERDLKDLTIL